MTLVKFTADDKSHFQNPAAKCTAGRTFTAGDKSHFQNPAAKCTAGRTSQTQNSTAAALALARLGATIDCSGLPEDNEAAHDVLIDRAATESDVASRALARMGAYLLAARARLPHGAFESSCAARGITRQRAAEAMRAAIMIATADSIAAPDLLTGSVARRMILLAPGKLDILARFGAGQLARLDHRPALDLIDNLAAVPRQRLRALARKHVAANLAEFASLVRQAREEAPPPAKREAPPETAGCEALAALAETQIAELTRRADSLPRSWAPDVAEGDPETARAAREIVAALDSVAERAAAAAAAARESLGDWLAVDCAAEPEVEATPADAEPEVEATPADAEPALDYDPGILWEQAARRTEAQRAKGIQRAETMGRLTRLAASGITMTEAIARTAAAESIAVGTIRNWYYGVNGRPGAKDYHPRDWPVALIPGHTGRTAEVEFSAEAWEFVKADYLRVEAPTLAACYQRLKRAAEAHGWRVPAQRTVERRLLALSPAVRTLRREGEHALRRLYPSQSRSVRGIRAGEWINGDGYRHNIFVARADGSMYRPKTWFWQDVYSRRILAWRTDETEHGDMIRLAFGDMIEDHGIPAHITIDNTRAVANKWLTGGVPNRYRFKVREEDPLGIFPLLGIEVHWTSIHAGKGHGQAKPVERAFGVGGIGEYVDKHPALAGAYTGPNPQAKPENYGGRGVDLKTFGRVLTEEIAAWNAREGRRTEVCHGELSFDQAFEESRRGVDVRRASPEQRRLWLLTAETVKVDRSGVLTLAAGAAGAARNRYGGEALLEHAGGQVAARFDPDRLHDALHVYTLDGRYIGAASCIEAAGFGDTAAAREHSRGRQQYIRAVKAAAKAETKISTTEALRYLPVGEEDDDSAEGVVEVDFRAAAAKTARRETEEFASQADAIILSATDADEEEEDIA